jgi:hypothetical protein
MKPLVKGIVMPGLNAIGLAASDPLLSHELIRQEHEISEAVYTHQCQERAWRELNYGRRDILHTH